MVPLKGSDGREAKMRAGTQAGVTSIELLTGTGGERRNGGSKIYAYRITCSPGTLTSDVNEGRYLTFMTLNF